MSSEFKIKAVRTHFAIYSSYFISVMLMLFVTPIFIETFSSYILGGSNPLFHSESKFIFFSSTLIGQITFPIFSSLDSGCLILPMFELNDTFKSILNNCLKTEYPLKNALLCRFTAGLLCFLICLTIVFTNQGKLFSKIPTNIVDSLMMSSAIGNSIIGFSWFKIDDAPVFSLFLCVVSFLITVSGIYILKKTNNPRLLVLYVFLIISGFNCLKFFYNSDTLVKNKIFITSKSEKLNIRPLLSAISKGHFDYSVISDNITQILTISISPIIALATSLPFYSRHFGLNPKYNREIFSIGMTNLSSAMSFTPVTFNTTGSIMFKICGLETRLHSILSGASVIVLYYTQHLIAPFLPRFSVSFISQFIGFSVLFQYTKMFPTLTRMDKAVLILTLLISILTKMNTIILLISGLLLSGCISLYFTGRCLSGNQSVILTEKGTIKIKEILDYRNIQCLVDYANEITGDIVLDLTDVKYVDYTANSKLDQLFKDMKNRKMTVTIMGQPCNFNSVMVNAMSKEGYMKNKSLEK